MPIPPTNCYRSLLRSAKSDFSNAAGKSKNIMLHVDLPLHVIIDLQESSFGNVSITMPTGTTAWHLIILSRNICNSDKTQGLILANNELKRM